MKTLTIGFLILVIMNGQLSADDHSAANKKITLSLNGASEVLVEGFIAPIEYTQYNYHVEWDELANLRVAEPEKAVFQHRFFVLFCPPKRFLSAISGRLRKRVRWNY